MVPSHHMIEDSSESEFDPGTSRDSTMAPQTTREAIVLVWRYDRLIEVTNNVDVGLIRNDANLTAPQKGIQIYLPLWEKTLLLIWQMRTPFLPPLQSPICISTFHFIRTGYELTMPQSGSTVDVVAFQMEFAKLWADIDALISLEEVFPEPAPEEDIGDVVLNALLGKDEPTLNYYLMRRCGSLKSRSWLRVHLLRGALLMVFPLFQLRALLRALLMVIQ
ncbi:hypothetical protein MTR67_026607 [Solanum verrucosum]|uniref:Uncharacterized protein n=1 Tax=Solanum verrucosum TaxID=315347 RepID=A0AAF0QZ95_SOLVR|nr:hypothetical protein MTR67_026607 [Solanum verrucosum]